MSKTQCQGCRGHGVIFKRDLVLLRTIKLPCNACGGEGFIRDDVEAFAMSEAERDREHDEYLRG